MESGLVSIIMPTYNRAKIICGAIESVLAQTYDRFELIIVDDGSTDDTSSVVKGVHDNRILYHAYSPNQGGNHARNIGLKLSRGEYISFLDTDNEWEPDFLKKQLNNLTKYGADFSVCRVGIHGSLKNGKIEIVPAQNHDIFRAQGLVDNSMLKRSMLASNLIDTNVVCIRRRCIEYNDGFNEKLKRLQDWEFFLRLLVTMECKVAFVPQVLVHSYLQKDSVRFKYDFLETFLYVFEKWLPLYKSCGMVENQCARIIGLSNDRTRRMAREDALVGLLKFLPEHMVKSAISRLGLNNNNFQNACKICCKSINIGSWYSVTSILGDREVAIYGGISEVESKLNTMPKVLEKEIKWIISEDSMAGSIHRGIPCVKAELFKDSCEKVFVLIVDEVSIKSGILQRLGYCEGVDYIDASNWY